MYPCIDVKKKRYRANLVIRNLHLCKVYLFPTGYSAMTGASQLGGSFSVFITFINAMLFSINNMEEKSCASTAFLYYVYIYICLQELSNIWSKNIYISVSYVYPKR